MKIACIATSSAPSSSANSIQLMKTCHALQQVNGPVRLFVPGNESCSWEKLADNYGLTTPFEVEWLPSRQQFKRYDFTWQSLRLAQKWGADIIYTWLLPAAVLALWQGLPVILELHDRIAGRLGPFWFRHFIRNRGKKRLLVITRALRRRLELDFQVVFPESLIQIAPNGADIERYIDLPTPPEARRKLGLAEAVTVGYTGHFYAGRGAELLFELARRTPQANFLWVGGRPEDVAEWEKRRAEAGLSNLVITGFVENSRLPLYQAASDILLMPYDLSIAGSSGGNSAEICSPMKMFDYLAAGRAIISSDLPVIHEVLNENNAIFCPPGNLSAWYTALSALLQDPQLQQRLAGQARQDATRYTWRARAEKAIEGW